MKKTFSHSALIRALQKLYSRISLIVLHKRINEYQKIATHKKHAHDIMSPLHECIDIIVGYALDNPEVVYTIGHLKSESATSNLHSHKKKHTAGQHSTVNQEHTRELSKYFRARSRGSSLHPGIREKLELSIWDHVHATIRCARFGNQHNSKIHADITDCACKELAHYMNKEDYQTFITEVKQHLHTLKSDHQNRVYKQNH